MSEKLKVQRPKKDAPVEEESHWIRESWKELASGRHDLCAFFRDGWGRCKGVYCSVVGDFKEACCKKCEKTRGESKEVKDVQRKVKKKWVPRAKEALNRFGEKGEAWTVRTSKKLNRGMAWLSHKVKHLFNHDEGSRK